MSAIKMKSLEINKANTNQTRIHEEDLDKTLEPDEVLIKIEKVSFTANNITYCLAGDTIGYWSFFPTDEGWGRMPGMGIGVVVESNSEQVKVGERLWGFYPFASHLKVKASKVNQFNFKNQLGGAKDVAPVYANYDRTGIVEAEDVETENLAMLLKGLFATAWLIEDFVRDNEHFGASQYLITSASSKTSIGLAHCIRAAGKTKAVAITSKSNRAFVDGLGCYDQVFAYEEVGGLDPSVASVVVDMAGSPKVLESIHKHFGEQIKYSSQVGITHQGDAFTPEMVAMYQSLPGAKPTFFFAPAQIQKRNDEWGTGVVEGRIAEALLAFIAFYKPQVTVHVLEGADKVQECYQLMLAGRAEPSEAYILSL